MADKPATIHDCHAAGLSIAQSAEALGITYSAARKRARRAGLRFRKDYSANAERAAEHMRGLHADPEFAKARDARSAEHMRRLNADPKFAKANAERMRRRQANPKFNPLAALSEAERVDYDTLKKAGYTRAEALETIGRGDLT